MHGLWAIAAPLVMKGFTCICEGAGLRFHARSTPIWRIITDGNKLAIEGAEAHASRRNAARRCAAVSWQEQNRRLLGISRRTLFDILSEKQPITPAMALRFGKLLGNGPDLWIDLQRAYDLHAAEKQLSKALTKIPTITAA
jgi:addiction module HigA family antidote